MKLTFLTKEKNDKTTVLKLFSAVANAPTKCLKYNALA
jgi:hypothetical protein